MRDLDLELLFLPSPAGLKSVYCTDYALTVTSSRVPVNNEPEKPSVDKRQREEWSSQLGEGKPTLMSFTKAPISHLCLSSCTAASQRRTTNTPILYTHTHLLKIACLALCLQPSPPSTDYWHGLWEFNQNCVRFVLPIIFFSFFALDMNPLAAAVISTLWNVSSLSVLDLARSPAFHLFFKSCALLLKLEP